MDKGSLGGNGGVYEVDMKSVRKAVLVALKASAVQLKHVSQGKNKSRISGGAFVESRRGNETTQPKAQRFKTLWFISTFLCMKCPDFMASGIKT